MDSLRRFWFSVVAAFRRRSAEDDLRDELAFHLEAEEEERRGQGVPSHEARAGALRSLGNPVLLREESRMVWTWTRLEQLGQDVRFGWRQLWKNKAASAAAILSLALAVGSCTAAFRLIDALLLRPLPVTGGERLYNVWRQSTGNDGKTHRYDGAEYPLFERMRAALGREAAFVAVSYAERRDLHFAGGDSIEKANVQFVSGSLFDTFGLAPAAGRLLHAADDRTPGAHPYAVVSHDYWTRRFGGDPGVAGRTFRMGRTSYEIVGVVESKFSGTEPGTMVDLYLPAMMHPSVTYEGSTWLRALVRPEPQVNLAVLRDRMQAISEQYQEHRAKGFKGYTKQGLTRFLEQRVYLEPASAGVSGMQQSYGLGLRVLAVLVGLVLLIACANVGSLLMAQASARGREMALRVSIGAGKARLVRLLLVESAWLAVLATVLGAGFAWWAAPYVVSLIGSADNPVRLSLPADGRVIGFSLLLACGVTFLFGAVPALRASSVEPATAIKGGGDPYARMRLMHGFLAAQAGFSVVVVFVSGLFVASFARMANQPVGFSPDNVTALYATAEESKSPPVWEQAAAQVRALPGVERAVLSDRALLDGYGWNNFISVNGGPPAERLCFLRSISPGWIETMKIPLLEGRTFDPSDRDLGLAVVNQTFAKTYLHGESPMGRTFEIPSPDGTSSRYRVIGLTADAKYRSMREAILPVAYLPFGARGRGEAVIVVRGAGVDVAAMRRAVAATAPGMRVSNVRPQGELIRMHTVRERMLAILAAFFAVVAMSLCAVGLFGLLDYSVVQRRREIGICVAIGAAPWDVVKRIGGRAAAMVLCGMGVGLMAGIASESYLESLLFGVKAAEPAMLAAPVLILLTAAVAAALPPMLRAIGSDPLKMLRVD